MAPWKSLASVGFGSYTCILGAYRAVDFPESRSLTRELPGSVEILRELQVRAVV